MMKQIGGSLEGRTASDLDVEDAGVAYLVEFSDLTPIQEFALDREEVEGAEKELIRAIASARGVALHRVVSPEGKVVAQFDPVDQRTPLDFAIDKGAFLVAFASPPHGARGYHWRLARLEASVAEKQVAVLRFLAMREAKPGEEERLNEVYPMWLQNVEAYDRSLGRAIS